MSPAIICTICGKKYPFKPELAGKKVKCKCGHVINVPAPAVKADEDSLYQLAPDPSKDAAKATMAPRGEGAEHDGSVNCPSCGSAVAPGSVICVSCGFNLKTGEQLSSVGGVSMIPGKAANPPPGQRFAGIPPGLSSKRVAEEPKSAVIMKFGLLFGAALLIVGVVFAMKFIGRDPDAGKPAADPDDETVRTALKEDFPKEVREWLTAYEQAPFGTMNRRQAEFKIEEWYRLGAKTVYAFGTQMAVWVAIELPPEPEKRAALFEWQKKWHADMRERIRTDKGQQYMVIKLPII